MSFRCLFMELAHCTTRLELACHIFFQLKAVHFSLFKQTPFQRKQVLIKSRCGQLVGVANTPEHTLNKIDTFFERYKCFCVVFMESFLNVLRT